MTSYPGTPKFHPQCQNSNNLSCNLCIINHLHDNCPVLYPLPTPTPAIGMRVVARKPPPKTCLRRPLTPVSTPTAHKTLKIDVLLYHETAKNSTFLERKKPISQLPKRRKSE